MHRPTMMPHTLRHMLAVTLALALLLAAAPSAHAQDSAAALPGEYGSASALGPDPDPQAAAIDDVLTEWGEESAAGTFTTTDPNQLAAVAMPELDDSTRASGILVDEHSELPVFQVGDPAFGSSYLFLPAVRRGSAGLPDTTAESAIGTLIGEEASELSAESTTAQSGGAGDQGATGDFNGDGYADLAIGAPQESLTIAGVELAMAGAVTVLYGSPTGLTAAGSQVWTQNSAGVADTAEAGDVFGCALAAGDFDGDGRADLAIGVCGESFADAGAPGHFVTEAGAVQVLFGTPSGLTAARSQLWTQDSAGVLDVAEEADGFGSALAAGDFDGDGRADLAVGVPFEDIAGRIDSGLVQAFYGATAGLAALPNTQRTQMWHQSVAGIPDLAEIGDGFGSALAAGDFNADGHAELAVSAPAEDLGADANPVVDAGVVHVIYGSAKGLSAAGAQRFSEDTVGIRGLAEARDFFGWSLAIGDFDGTGAADLAIGIPMEDFTPANGTGLLTNAGAVAVVYSSGLGGLTAPSSRIVTQSVAGMLGGGMVDSAETGDTFGHSLAAAQTGGSPAAALVVGIPSEDLGPIANAGAVHIVYGPLVPGQDAAVGANTLWTQDSAGVLDAAETADGFGLTVAGGDFDGSGATDLVFGVPREDLGGIRDAGAVNVVANPLGTPAHGFWAEDIAGIPGLAEPGDLFGQLGQ